MMKFLNYSMPGAGESNRIPFMCMVVGLGVLLNRKSQGACIPGCRNPDEVSRCAWHAKRSEADAAI